MKKRHIERSNIRFRSSLVYIRIIAAGFAGAYLTNCHVYANENTPQQAVDSIQALGEAVDYLKASREAIINLDARSAMLRGSGFTQVRKSVLIDDIKALQKTEFGKVLSRLDGVFSAANFAITYTEYQIDIYNAYKSGKIIDYLDLAQKAVSDTISNNSGLGGMVVGKLFDYEYETIKQIGIEINNNRAQQIKSAEAAITLTTFYTSKSVLAYYLPTLEELRSLGAGDSLGDVIKHAEDKYVADLEGARATLYQLRDNVSQPEACLILCGDVVAARDARINQINLEIKTINEYIHNVRTGGSIALDMESRIFDGMEYLIAEDLRSINQNVTNAKTILSQKIDNGLVETRYVKPGPGGQTIIVDEVTPTFSARNVNAVRLEPLVECVGVACPTTAPTPVASTWAGQIVGAKGYSNGPNAGSVTAVGAITATGVTNGQTTDLTIVTQSGIGGTASGVAHIDGGYQYTAWGDWNGRIDGDGVNQSISNLTRGQWVVGLPTKDSPAVRQIGQATYSGNLKGDYIASNGTLYQNAIGGSMRMQVDFTGMTVDSYFHILRASDNSTIADTSVTGSQIYAVQTSGATYFGYNNTQSGANGAVTGVAGTFFGPKAEEAGGSWSYRSPSMENISGVFRARR